MQSIKCLKRHKAAGIVCRLLLFLLPLIWVPQASGLTGTVNINTASLKELQELPYIGEQRARAIIRFRSENDGFKNFDELLEVTHIGEKSLEAIKPYLSLGPTSPSSRKTASSAIRKKIRTRPGDIIMLPDKKYYDSLVDGIRGADRTIHVAMFLFKTTPSPQNKPALLVKELIKAQKRGIAIRVVLENSGYEESINKENRKVARKLRKNGIKVFFDSAKRTNHAKIVVIDRRYSFIGSHNLSHSALSYNHEFSLLIDNTDLAEELVDYIEEIH